MIIADVPVNNQLSFQNPATLIMDGIIDLHHDIMTFLIFIIISIIYVLFTTLYHFQINDFKNNTRIVNIPFMAARHINHHATLEII